MNVLEAWFMKAVAELKMGEEFYLPVETRAEAAIKRKELLKIKLDYEQVDPIEASKMDVLTTFRFQDKKFYIILRKRENSPLIGFKKGWDGKTRRSYLNGDLDRERRIKLMLADGMSLEEVEEAEGELSEEERKLFREASDVEQG